MAAANHVDLSESTKWGLRLPSDLGKTRNIMRGAEYLSSLMDGRHVIDGSGETVSDVVGHPQLGPAARLHAECYDSQWNEDDSATLTTEVDGRATSTAWVLPRSKEDLERRREYVAWVTRKTLGAFGRPFDYGYGTAGGLLLMSDVVATRNPDWAANIRGYVDFGMRHNLMTFGLGADVQSDRRIPIAERPGRLRCVRETSEGLFLSGAKPCASGATQAHLGVIYTAVTPGVNPDAMVYCAIPANAPGLTMLMRESVSGTSNVADHPIDSAVGEEVDSLLLFDEVFIPQELIFNYGNPDLLLSYYKIQGLTHWQILTRLAYKAEILAAAGDLVGEVLGTKGIPQVRDDIAELTAYADSLMAFVLAAERDAEIVDGICIPSERFVTPGRLYSVTELPRMLQILRNISGQGMISRYTEAMWLRSDVGPALGDYMPGTGCSAWDKNLLFNFLWDLTCSGNAMRTALFENVNSLPASGMRARLFESDARAVWSSRLAERLGISLTT